MEKEKQQPKEKDVIRWQYVEHYYPYMIDKLKLIDSALQYGNYLVAFTELNSLFIQINNPILKEKPETFQALIDLKEEIREKINVLTYLQLGNHHNRIKIKQMSGVMGELSQQIDKFYMLLMGVMDELNMFFPREKKDLRLPIYRG